MSFCTRDHYRIRCITKYFLICIYLCNPTFCICKIWFLWYFALVACKFFLHWGTKANKWHKPTWMRNLFSLPWDFWYTHCKSDLQGTFTPLVWASPPCNIEGLLHMSSWKAYQSWLWLSFVVRGWQQQFLNVSIRAHQKFALPPFEYRPPRAKVLI